LGNPPSFALQNPPPLKRRFLDCRRKEDILVEFDEILRYAQNDIAKSSRSNKQRPCDWFHTVVLLIINAGEVL